MIERINIQCRGAPLTIAFSWRVYNSNVTMVYGCLWYANNYSIHGVYKPANITGGPHIVRMFIHSRYRLVGGLESLEPWNFIFPNRNWMMIQSDEFHYFSGGLKPFKISLSCFRGLNSLKFKKNLDQNSSIFAGEHCVHKSQPRTVCWHPMEPFHQSWLTLRVHGICHGAINGPTGVSDVNL